MDAAPPRVRTPDDPRSLASQPVAIDAPRAVMSD